MEEAHSIFNFGHYTHYIWSAVGMTLGSLFILFWRSQRQLTKQKRIASHSQKNHEG